MIYGYDTENKLILLAFTLVEKKSRNGLVYELVALRSNLSWSNLYNF
jgi:hypothetical protein